MVKKIFRLYNSIITEVSNKQKILVDDKSSIANNAVDILAQRRRFFLPRFTRNYMLYYLKAIVMWVLLSNTFFISENDSFGHFLFDIVRDLLFFLLTVIPSLLILQSYREELKRQSIPRVCLQVTFVFIFNTVLAMVVVGFVTMLYSKNLQMNVLAVDTLLNVLSISVSVIFMLMYYLNRYLEFLKLEEAFKLQLSSQNELFNARMSPHFFFNTINGLTSLVESEPEKAVVMLANISTLFRASFDDTDEISMIQEVELCQVFLHIDEMRFHSKLEVNWNMPDEDTMYDMVISGLTLQRVLEKVLYRVVEMTTENIKVNIDIAWEDHTVRVTIDVELPSKTLLIRYDLAKQMNFDIQEQRLKQFFGDESYIEGDVKKNTISVNVVYPLHDPCIDTINYDDIDINNADMFL